MNMAPLRSPLFVRGLARVTAVISPKRVANQSRMMGILALRLEHEDDTLRTTSPRRHSLYVMSDPGNISSLAAQLHEPFLLMILQTSHLLYLTPEFGPGVSL